MKIYSDILTEEMIRENLPRLIDAQIEVLSSRKRKYGYIVHLRYVVMMTGPGSGRRRVNSGEHGSGYHYAATWDEHGIWMDLLFDIDPDAEISYYKNRADFMAQTTAYQAKGSKAPWLKREEVAA